MEQRIANDGEQFSVVTEAMVDGLIVIDAADLLLQLQPAARAKLASSASPPSAKLSSAVRSRMRQR